MKIKRIKLSPEFIEARRQWCSKGGKGGGHDDKVRAGELGHKAAVKNWMKKAQAESKEMK